MHCVRLACGWIESLEFLVDGAWGDAMELGLIGLGKMGFNMAARLREGGNTVVGFDFNCSDMR